LIASLNVGLTTEAEIRLKGLGGEALHGLVFTVLSQSSLIETSELHDSDEQKPFSISPFIDGHKLRGGFSFLDRGKTATFRICTFTEELLAAFVQAFFLSMAEGKILRLSGKPVTLNLLNFGQNENNSITSFNNLFTKALAEPVITLEFASPTCFKGKGIQTMFPEPKLVFSSLLKRWNAFSDEKINEEYQGLFTTIKVSSYNLRTELIHFSKYKMIGFKGNVEYRLPDKSIPEFQKSVNALANFACYAGVGAKTAMGMGQVNRINT